MPEISEKEKYKQAHSAIREIIRVYGPMAQNKLRDLVRYSNIRIGFRPGRSSLHPDFWALKTLRDRGWLSGRKTNISLKPEWKPAFTAAWLSYLEFRKPYLKKTVKKKTTVR
ncbi:MAG: hypothetical protein AABX01_03350 [Candidatus Micrarchaeota archaeon]